MAEGRRGDHEGTTRGRPTHDHRATTHVRGRWAVAARWKVGMRSGGGGIWGVGEGGRECVSDVCVQANVHAYVQVAVNI